MPNIIIGLLLKSNTIPVATLSITKIAGLLLKLKVILLYIYKVIWLLPELKLITWLNFTTKYI